MYHITPLHCSISVNNILSYLRIVPSFNIMLLYMSFNYRLYHIMALYNYTIPYCHHIMWYHVSHTVIYITSVSYITISYYISIVSQIFMSYSIMSHHVIYHRVIAAYHYVIPSHHIIQLCHDVFMPAFFIVLSIMYFHTRVYHIISCYPIALYITILLPYHSVPFNHSVSQIVLHLHISDHFIFSYRSSSHITVSHVTSAMLSCLQSLCSVI